jgi:hypothetical protein
MPVRDLAQALEIAGLRRDDPRVHHHRFEDHPGDAPGMLFEHPLHGIEIVERHDPDEIGDDLRDAGPRHATRVVDRAEIVDRPPQ